MSYQHPRTCKRKFVVEATLFLNIPAWVLQACDRFTCVKVMHFLAKLHDIKPSKLEARNSCPAQRGVVNYAGYQNW